MIPAAKGQLFHKTICIHRKATPTPTKYIQALVS
jgi:hypothetical protein